MLEAIFIILGLTKCTDILFQKWGVWERIMIEGSKSNSKFLYNLVTCNFCLNFHICWMITIAFGVLNQTNIIELIVIPFVVMGLFKLIEKNDL